MMPLRAWTSSRLYISDSFGLAFLGRRLERGTSSASTRITARFVPVALAALLARLQSLLATLVMWQRLQPPSGFHRPEKLAGRTRRCQATTTISTTTRTAAPAGRARRRRPPEARLLRQGPPPAGRPGRLPPQGRQRQGHLRRQGRAPERSGSAVLLPGPAPTATPRPRALVRQIADFDYIVTDSETDALVLEDQLIKEYRPRYNIRLKDDKRTPTCGSPSHEPFPRVDRGAPPRPRRRPLLRPLHRRARHARDAEVRRRRLPGPHLPPRPAGPDGRPRPASTSRSAAAARPASATTTASGYRATGRAAWCASSTARDATVLADLRARDGGAGRGPALRGGGAPARPHRASSTTHGLAQPRPAGHQRRPRRLRARARRRRRLRRGPARARRPHPHHAPLPVLRPPGPRTSPTSWPSCCASTIPRAGDIPRRGPAVARRWRTSRTWKDWLRRLRGGARARCACRCAGRRPRRRRAGRDQRRLQAAEARCATGATAVAPRHARRPRSCRRPSACARCRRPSTASTSRTSRAARRSARWSSSRTASRCKSPLPPLPHPHRRGRGRLRQHARRCSTATTARLAATGRASRPTWSSSTAAPASSACAREVLDRHGFAGAELIGLAKREETIHREDGDLQPVRAAARR